MKLLPILVALAVASGCQGPGASRSAAGSPEEFVSELGSWTTAEARGEARALLARFDLGDVDRAKLERRIDELCADPVLQAEIRDWGVQAVVALAGAGGGLIARRSFAAGFASFAGGDSAVPVETESTVYGAVIGGSRTYSVAVVTRLERAEDLAGPFDLTIHTGSLADTSAGAAHGAARHGPQRFWATLVSAGGEGTAGWGSGTLAFTDRRD